MKIDNNTLHNSYNSIYIMPAWQLNWGLLKWWYPQVIYFNIFRFYIINHPAIGVSPLMQPTWTPQRMAIKSATNRSTSASWHENFPTRAHSWSDHFWLSKMPPLKKHPTHQVRNWPETCEELTSNVAIHLIQRIPEPSQTTATSAMREL